MLNLLEKFNMTEFNGLNSHRLVEILKFGMAARTKLTDPHFTDNTNEIDAISTKAFADIVFPNITDVSGVRNHVSRFKYLQDSTHPPDYYNPVFDIKVDHGTVSKIVPRTSLYKTPLRAMFRLQTRMGWLYPLLLRLIMSLPDSF